MKKTAWVFMFIIMSFAAAAIPLQTTFETGAVGRVEGDAGSVIKKLNAGDISLGTALAYSSSDDFEVFSLYEGFAKSPGFKSCSRTQCHDDSVAGAWSWSDLTQTINKLNANSLLVLQLDESMKDPIGLRKKSILELNLNPWLRKSNFFKLIVADVPYALTHPQRKELFYENLGKDSAVFIAPAASQSSQFANFISCNLVKHSDAGTAYRIARNAYALLAKSDTSLPFSWNKNLENIETMLASYNFYGLPTSSISIPLKFDEFKKAKECNSYTVDIYNTGELIISE